MEFVEWKRRTAAGITLMIHEIVAKDAASTSGIVSYEEVRIGQICKD
jgi:hypothetical protein